MTSTVPAPTRVEFGERLTDHMVVGTWTAAAGWRLGKATRREPIALDPATVALHYGQAIFEGLKAFRQPDGGLAVFRPAFHALRFQRSARRLAMPELPVDAFTRAVEEVVRADATALPEDPNLYLRPLMLASEPKLALRPATEYLFLMMAFVTGGFFSDEPRPVTVWISRDYTRASAGGTGDVKYAGNYAPTYLAQQQAKAAGCAQVIWLDPVRRRLVEEMGGMNLFVVRGSGARAEVVTPRRTGTLLAGATRDSLLCLANDLGYRAGEQDIDVDQWRAECEHGVVTEVFACGTAAGVTPIGQIRDGADGWQVGDGTAGPVTLALRAALTNVQTGRAEDRHGWLHRVVDAR